MPEPQKTEICIICREDTGIPQDLHVDHRDRKGCYVQGAGQLCLECHTKIYSSETEAERRERERTADEYGLPADASWGEIMHSL